MKRPQKAVRDYLTMRRGLGFKQFKLAKHEVVLQEFVSFLERKRSTHITSIWHWSGQRNIAPRLDFVVDQQPRVFPATGDELDIATGQPNTARAWGPKALGL
jgi:hypothetical protein